MTMGDREGLITRIRQVRRLASTRHQSESQASGPPAEPLQALEARVAHLEQMVQGLQDSVYRESERHSRLISELQTQVDPGAMSESLAKDARTRGL
jgi:hypothetical protein